MPSIYDIDFTRFNQRMLPPDKRFTTTVAWVNVLLKPLQYLRDVFMGDYRTGSSASQWVAGTYSKYEQVKYKGSVYESLIGSNTETPTTQTAWRVLLPNFIGVEERLTYNGDKLVFEYAINKYFGTVFRQPNNTSDIFIERFTNPFNVFLVGGDENSSSVTYSNRSAQFIINDYDFAAFYNMHINVPAAVFAALDPDPANCDKIIRNFADLYIVSGVTYQIVTY